MENSKKQFDIPTGQISGVATIQDRDLAVEEIRKIRAARINSAQNINRLQNLVQQQQKLIQERKVVNENLRKRNSELMLLLENETYQKSSVKKQIEKLRNLSKNTVDLLTLDNQTLELCKLTKENDIRKAFELQTGKVNKNLLKMEKKCKNKSYEVTLMKNTYKNQVEVNRNYIKGLEDEELKIKEKCTNFEFDIETLCREIQDLSEQCENCIEASVETEKQNVCFKVDIQNRKCQKDNIIEMVEQQQQAFEFQYEEISQTLDDSTYELHKDENDIENLKMAIKNQENYCSNIEEKCKDTEVQNADLQQQTEQLECFKNDEEHKSAENEKRLQDSLTLYLTEVNNNSLLVEEENKNLIEMIKAIECSSNGRTELMLHVDQLKEEIHELQTQDNGISQVIKTTQTELNLLITEQKQFEQEFSLLIEKSKSFELESSETLFNKEAELNTLTSDVDHVKHRIEEINKSIHEQMNSIKLDFDTKTAQQMKEFESDQNKIEGEIQAVEKEHQAILELDITGHEDLKKLNKECDLFKSKIKNLEVFNHIFANYSTLEKSIQNSAKPMQIAQSPFLPPMPIRERSVDEFSGSSAEGSSYTQQQITALKQDKERRRKLKEQRKLQMRKFNSPKKSPK